VPVGIFRSYRKSWGEIDTPLGEKKKKELLGCSEKEKKNWQKDCLGKTGRLFFQNTRDKPRSPQKGKTGEPAFAALTKDEKEFLRGAEKERKRPRHAAGKPSKESTTTISPEEKKSCGNHQ